MILLVLLAAVTWAGVYLARSAWRATQTYGWPTTSAVMLESYVRPAPDQTLSHTLFVQFEYVWEGRTHRSKSYGRDSDAYDSDHAYELADEYSPGRMIVCYVNPADPDEAVLKRGNLLLWLLVMATPAFLYAGIRVLIHLWRSCP